MTIDLRIATRADATTIMRFMDEHWRAGHILSRRQDLLLHDFLNFKDNQRLNIALAFDRDNLVGLFGYMFYNSSLNPDMAGSLWKVIDSKRYPMLGIELRNYVMEHVPHRFFAAPGAGPQTESIYRFLGMEWGCMDHWYMLNPYFSVEQFKLVQTNHNPHAGILLPSLSDGVTEISDCAMLNSFPFARYEHRLPSKDADYFCHKFIKHPIHTYQLFWLKTLEADALVVLRNARVAEGHAWRMVDYYGDEACMSLAARLIQNRICATGAEFADFVASGWGAVLMTQAGFVRLQHEHTEPIIPNFFEPLLRKNVPVYYVSDPVPPGRLCFMCRADGDQDRPNF